MLKRSVCFVRLKKKLRNEIKKKSCFDIVIFSVLLYYGNGTDGKKENK